MALRNGGIISVSEYSGKTLQEAIKYANDGGFITRIVEENGSINGNCRLQNKQTKL